MDSSNCDRRLLNLQLQKRPFLQLALLVTAIPTYSTASDIVDQHQFSSECMFCTQCMHTVLVVANI